MSRIGRALLASVLALAAASCADDRPAPGEARLEVDGTAVVERVDGDRETVTGGTDLRAGDQVELREGIGRLELADGSVLELREGVDDRADSVVVMGRTPVLAAGDLLVSAESSTRLEADGTVVQVTDGSAKLRRDIGMSVASYDAVVALDSAGVDRSIEPLRRMVVPDLGRPPQHPRPVRYDEADTWDRRYLGAAHALGERLQRMADGLTGSLADGEGRTPGFFRSVLPGLDGEPSFGASLLAPRLDEPPGDTLVGAAIVDLGERGDFLDRWRAVFEFHDDGAEWGIVALDQAVRSEPLLGEIELALDSAFEDVAFGPPDGAPGGPPTPGDPVPPGGADPNEPAPPTSGPTPPTTAPTGPSNPPPVAPEPPPLDPVVAPVTDLVDEAVDTLLGGLLG